MDLVFRFLQLFAEGHNLRMQEYLQGQSNNRVSFNLISEAVNHLSITAKNTAVIRSMSNEDIESLHSLFDFLIEVIQGPCKKNQVYILNKL